MALVCQTDRLPPDAFGVTLAFVVQALVQHAQGVLGLSCQEQSLTQ
jgi:hypothetical protein